MPSLGYVFDPYDPASDLQGGPRRGKLADDPATSPDHCNGNADLTGPVQDFL